MSASIDSLIPELQPFARALVDVAGAAGLMPRVTSTYRSNQEQARLYRRYQQGLQTLPVAPPGTSAHEFGYAMDLVVTPFSALNDLGAWWTSNGGVWGGAFRDPVHFEYPGFSAPTAASSDSGITLEDVKDFVATLPVPFSVDIVVMLAQFFAPSTILDYIQHPSRAVRAYPWLRALGAPFVFY